MSFILTIDDSPTDKTDILLEFLNYYNIKAIFFCIGKNMLTYSHIIDRMILEDHIVANHSYSHKRFSKIKNIYSEILETDRLIDRFYKKNDKVRKVKYFRFPYQDKGIGFNPIKIIFKNYSYKYLLTQSILKALGYKNLPILYRQTKNPLIKLFINDYDVFTNLNLKDWKMKQLEPILSKITKIDINSYYILQLHDKSDNMQNVIKIIEKLIEVGADFTLP